MSGISFSGPSVCIAFTRLNKIFVQTATANSCVKSAVLSWPNGYAGRVPGSNSMVLTDKLFSDATLLVLFCLSGCGDPSSLARSVTVLKFADQCQLSLQQYSKSASIFCADELNLQDKVSASSLNCNCTHYIKAV
jgi:hypothetical protein